MRLNFDEWMIRQGRLGGARYGNGAFYFVGWRTTADIMVAASYVRWSSSSPTSSLNVEGVLFMSKDTF